jgi:NAD(P)-dependent dehydrogenase (short-subunit alcohol dehydrogenase family)
MTVLIFGGGGGIGSAVARKLVARGQAVHLAGRSALSLEAVGQPYTVADVTDEAQVQAAVAAVGPSLSALVYAVGSIVIKPLKGTQSRDFVDAFALNLVGAAVALKAAAPALMANKGSVVLFSTVAVAQGFANHTVISAAKGAVEGFARAAAADLAPHVRVNCVAPSLTRTPLAKLFTASDAMAQGIAKLHALERLGEPEDIAGLTAFLLSSEATWITGQIIGVDGGRATLRAKG